MSTPPSAFDDSLDDVRSSDPVERLMEDSWVQRHTRVSRRELSVETAAAVLFLAVSTPLAVLAPSIRATDALLAAALVLIYALVSRMIKLPLGAGYVVPSYVALVPMLLLLSPREVPLLTAGGLVLGTLAQVAARRAQPERVLFAISDAWHALGPAVVLTAAGPVHGGGRLALLYLGAFLAGCLVDLVSSTVREGLIIGVRPNLQLRVVALVWLIDACLAPLGLLVALAARQHHAAVLLLIPLSGLMLGVSRERTARIAESQRRLDVIARERTRLQTAVRRLGEALAAKLDLDALLEVVLRGSVDALDADGGRLALHGLGEARTIETALDEPLLPALEEATGRSLSSEGAVQVERDGACALALPFGFFSETSRARGTLAVVRDRAFRDDEEGVMRDLLQRAQQAAAEIVAHEALRQQVLTDPLTRLGNRRKLEADAERWQLGRSGSPTLLLILLDLDGFKSYNDTFGHLAGDELLSRLGTKLSELLPPEASAYRLGGDEFCVVARARPHELLRVLTAATGALEERGREFGVRPSYGAVLVPHEATTLAAGLQLADQRMYALKRTRPSASRDQIHDLLMRIIHGEEPALESRPGGVGQLALRVGRRLGMRGEELDELGRAAELHDIGKIAIPEAILDKPEGLDAAEWTFMRQHTIVGERILSAAPALRPVAAIVRATHERWDGDGYPDRISGGEIPLGARIIAACDAYEAMTSERRYRPDLGHDAACEELRREAGRQFDPRVVAVLLEELEALREEGWIPQELSARAARPDHVTRQVVASLREVLARHERTEGSVAGG